MLIRDKDKNLLIDIFSTINQKFEVWAYGSRVNGNAHNGSDLDLVIRTVDLKPISKSDYSLIKSKIYDSNIPILVQIYDWARLPEYFQPYILNKYEVLYSN